MVEAGLLSLCLFFSLWEEGLVIQHIQPRGGGEIKFATGQAFVQLKLWNFFFFLNFTILFIYLFIYLFIFG